MKKVLTILLPAMLVFAMADAQIDTPAPSPSSELSQTVGLTDFTINYSRPSMKGRDIFKEDGLVPFAQIWRTGANGATTVEFSRDINFGGKDVEAGKYALYTIPGASSWSVMLYSDLTMGGNVGNYDEANEVARVSVEASTITATVQTLTIGIGNITNESCNLEILWESTWVGIPIKVHTGDQVNAQIEAFASNPMGEVSGNYLNAGWYMYSNGGDLTKANEYMQKGCEYTSSPYKFYWLDRASQVQAAAGDYSGALETAAAAHEAGMNAPDNSKGFYEETVKAQIDANIKDWSGK